MSWRSLWAVLNFADSIDVANDTRKRGARHGGDLPLRRLQYKSRREGVCTRNVGNDKVLRRACPAGTRLAARREVSAKYRSTRACISLNNSSYKPPPACSYTVNVYGRSPPCRAPRLRVSFATSIESAKFRTAKSDRQLIERFLIAAGRRRVRVLVQRHGPMVRAVCRSPAWRFARW